MEITIAVLTALIGRMVAYAGNVLIAFDAAAGQITSGRARSLVGVAIALTSVVVGWLARSRARSARGGRAGAVAALILGLTGLVFSAVHLAGSTGFGTGGGRAGAIVGLALALIGMILGGLALARSYNIPESTPGAGPAPGNDRTEARL